MPKIKSLRKIINLVCITCQQNKDIAGFSHYTTVKNKKNTLKRLILRKFCFFCKSHQFYHEIK
uniref:Large ribosomal subunit protein bL33c n=1 Tax=Pteridomonas danica TaxID=38822 RepID=A0A7T1C539_9STRA|nr:ribosomal protein L33 [Pteridomonas danica]QPM99304.1 ribosomal protein L33 [Pteridomonas danica]